MAKSFHWILALVESLTPKMRKSSPSELHGSGAEKFWIASEKIQKVLTFKNRYEIISVSNIRVFRHVDPACIHYRKINLPWDPELQMYSMYSKEMYA